MAEALAPLARIADLERYLGRELDADADITRAESVLSLASDMVRDEAGKDWTPEDVPRRVRAIVLAVAERAVRNPDGFSSESAGDYSYQRVGVPGGIGGLYLTKDEIKILTRLSGKSGLWVQPTTKGEGCTVTEYLDDQYGCDPIPIADWPNY